MMPRYAVYHVDRRFYAFLLVFTCALLRVCLARAKSSPTFRRHARAPATLLFNPYSPLRTLAYALIYERCEMFEDSQSRPS